MTEPLQNPVVPKLISLLRSPRYATDPHFALALMARVQKFPADIQDAVIQGTFDPATPVDGPVRRSRRLDREADFHRRREGNAAERRPAFVKVLIAGSGHNGWKTHVDSAGAVLEWNRADNPEAKDEAAYHQRDKGKGAELMFAGPGSRNSKGGAHQGSSDTGSNSIAELVTQVPPLISRAVEATVTAMRAEAVAAGDADANTGAWPVEILIKAHSRGAVAASRIASAVKAQYPQAHVELAQVDPVPGPLHRGKNVEIDLGAQEDGGGGLDESTVVYSVASGYPVGFTPQKVHGAKRIIISKQNHSVGLVRGFVYEGELFKGSSLNSLGPGVYVDMNDNGQNTIPLRRVAEIEEARQAIKAAFKTSEARSRDYDRLPIIKAILTEFLDRA